MEFFNKDGKDENDNNDYNDDIYYYKYLKYKTKYLELFKLFKKKNKIAVGDDTDDTDEIDKPIQSNSTNKLSLPNLSHINKNEMEIKTNSNRTVSSEDTNVSSNHELEVNEVIIENIKQKIGKSNFFYIINFLIHSKIEEILSNYNGFEYIKEDNRLSVMKSKRFIKDEKRKSEIFNMINMINKNYENYIKSLSLNQLNQLRKKSCEIETKSKIIDLIDMNSDCIDNRTESLLLSNLYILEENYDCELIGDDFKLFDKYIDKKKCT